MSARGGYISFKGSSTMRFDGLNAVGRKPQTRPIAVTEQTESVTGDALKGDRTTGIR